MVGWVGDGWRRTGVDDIAFGVEVVQAHEEDFHVGFEEGEGDGLVPEALL